MFQLQLHVDPKTEQRLKTILAHTENEETFAQNIIAYQISEIRKSLLSIRLELRKFEAEHGQSTEQFYRQYEQGLTDDSEETMLWAGLYEMLQDNERRLRELA
jgi:hypothetical protein